MPRAMALGMPEDQVSEELAALIAGYRRFREKGWHPQRSRWDQLREGQSPKVMVIACADSRTDPAQVFDADPGEIFVVRNIAAMVPPFETSPGLHGVSAALEFAVQVLKVREIVHTGPLRDVACHRQCRAALGWLASGS